jgi:hypothetical protein
VKVWYYPGERIGNEFVYPKSQAVRIARETHQSVLATNDDSKMANTAGEIPVEAKTAALGRFDENGKWESEADKPVVMSNAPAANTAKAATTTAPMARAETQTAGTAGTRPARQHLPRTASNLALFELISGLSFAGGFAARRLRLHLS